VTPYSKLPEEEEKKSLKSTFNSCTHQCIWLEINWWESNMRPRIIESLTRYLTSRKSWRWFTNAIAFFYLVHRELQSSQLTQLMGYSFKLDRTGIGPCTFSPHHWTQLLNMKDDCVICKPAGKKRVNVFPEGVKMGPSRVHLDGCRGTG
jgi:hypothetical protein